MSDRYFAAVNWGARKESLDECVTRSEALFRDFARCDSALGRWFSTGRSRKEALSHPVTPDTNTLRKLFFEGRNRNDSNRMIIEDLGFSLDVWNGGEDGEAVWLRIHCGCYSPWVGNSCILKLPSQGTDSQRLLRASLLADVITCMASTLEPDGGIVGSHRYLELRPEANERDPRIGWLVYVSNRLGRVPLVPAPATVVPVGTKGSLIITTPERFSVDNPAHVVAADGVLAALEAAGLRKPVTR